MHIGEQSGETSGPESQERPPLLVMQDQLNASPGYRAVALMERVKRIAYILQANLGQYNSLVAEMQKPEIALPILDLGDPRKHDELLSEAERLLHNVVVAIKTRVDHLRAFMDRHFSDDADLLVEYHAKVRANFDNASSKFLDRLRNHMAHHLLPVAYSRQTLSQDESFQFTFLLDSASLLEWDWPSGVKPWIEQQGSEVRIVDVVNDYGRRAGECDKWLHDRIGLKFRSELEQYYADAEIFNQAVDRLFGS